MREVAPTKSEALALAQECKLMRNGFGFRQKLRRRFLASPPDRGGDGVLDGCVKDCSIGNKGAVASP